MELLQHWLETGKLSEDDLSVHYTNFFQFRKEEDDKYDNDTSSCSVGFDGSLPIFGLKNGKLVVISHNCPMMLDLSESNKTRAFSGYNHETNICLAKMCPDGNYLATKSSKTIGIWNIDRRCLQTHFEVNCLDFCWINNALIATLTKSDSRNQIEFWNWNGNSVIQDGFMPISDQQRILPNYAFTQANKSQIIAYAPGSSSITLVSKIDIEHEYLDAKFGHIHDIATNRIKLLLVFSTKGQVLVYETSKGCQLMKTASLNCHSFKFLKETLTTYLLGDSRGGVNIYDKSFKLLEKIKVSTEKIVSAAVSTSFCNEEKEIYLSDEKARIFKKFVNCQDNPKIVYDGSLFQSISAGDCHPHGTVFSCGNSYGKLFHFDTKTCELLEEISLGEGQINVLKYSPKGTFLGLGTSSGDIIFWPALERDENKPIKCSSKGITFLAFNQSENLIAFSDEIQVIGILKSDQLSWKIDARVKVHTKTITGITFTNEKDLFSIGLDRKICHIEDNILKLRRTVDKFSDPILINHCQDFLIIGTSNRQIRFVNPETLLTRRILDSPGIPKAIFQPKFGHCIFICEEGIVIGDSDWPTTVDFWNIASQGLLKVSNTNSIADIGFGKLKSILASSKLIMARDLDRPTEVELERCLKDIEIRNIKKWKLKVSRLLKILDTCLEASKSTLNMIHVEDLELILNGLGYSPTNVQLEEMAFEIRFRDSHVTWEVHESIYIDDFCQIIENYGKWLNLSKIEEVEKEETKSISEFIEKSVDTFKCFTSFLTGVEEFEDKSEEFQTENQTENQTEDQTEDQTENQTEDITEDQTEDQTEDKTEGHSEAYQSEEGQESEEDYE